VRSPSSHSALAILLAAIVSGCSPIYVDWDNHTIRKAPLPSEQAAIPATRTPSDNLATHRRSASLQPHKRRPPPSSADEQETTIEPDRTGISPQAPPASSESATISMASPGDSSGSAAKVIDSTSRRLARFDRNRLNGPTLATYDEANGFLNQSKQALTEKDYVAASGFAQKAAVLADKLQATVMAR